MTRWRTPLRPSLGGSIPSSRTGLIALIASVVLLSGTSAAMAGVATAHKGILPPKNPSKSLAPRPDFMSFESVCNGGKDSQKCNSEILVAIARARKDLEKLGGMSFSLPAYEKLSRTEQLFVTANLERTARGLPAAVALTRSLDKVAQTGANSSDDPPLGQVPSRLPGGGVVVGLGGNWAGGLDNALGADYGWMYYDGLGGLNEDCTKSDTQGCWGHRDNILGTFSSSAACDGGKHELAMGAGYAKKANSQTELFAGICGHDPTDVVLSWAKARRLLHVK
jgi:hypothetical protein